jgi:tRNA (guanine37-N1)-methyltransferase
MKKEKCTALCVQVKQAETVRKYLQEKNYLREDLKIDHDTSYVYFPVKGVPPNLQSSSLITRYFNRKQKPISSYKEIVNVPNNLKSALPTSYDVIGDIILIKIPENLQRYQKNIGKALLEANKNIRSVYRSEPVTGEYRTRNITLLAGEKRTTTVHKEYDLVFEVDIQYTYFSPRLASERKRVAELVQPEEIIVDMFAGVAPFSVMIAHYATPKIVYAVDKNPQAVHCAKHNIKLNNVLDKVEVIHADAKEIQTRIPTLADRIIMNLPFSVYSFFPDALTICREQTRMHYYEILKKDEVKRRIDDLKHIAKKHKYLLSEIKTKVLKTYTPREFYMGIDITATKMPM